jgi:predicted 3-demethylubiquinone-9 3-methyltransferase (glyoxalase superfamily)
MPKLSKITPCLWFDNQGEEAANFYVVIFKNSKINRISRYTEAGKEHHRQPVGSAMVVEFELEGQTFTALNGGPIFKFTEAISFQVMCDTQDEIDYFWNKLSSGGDPKAQQCGWLKDKFGLSWQIVPSIIGDIMTSGKPGQAEGAMNAVMKMKKIDLAELKRAAGVA